MKDITHYFADSFKTSETSPAETKQVNLKDTKLSEDTKATKVNSASKKRSGRKSKSTSPNFSKSKKSKSNLSTEKSKQSSNVTKDNLPKNSVLNNTVANFAPENPLRIACEENLNENSSVNSQFKNVDSSDFPKNEQLLIDMSVDENGVYPVKDETEENNVQNRKTQDENVDNSFDQTFKDVEFETVIKDDKKKKLKEKIKVLAEKKGFAKRKLIEEEEAEEMEKKLQARKNVFTNVPKKDENQVEIIHKPPAYSLLNYFSKSTPEQRQKEEAARCKISVRAEVHTPKESDTSNSTPHSTPKSSCSRSLQDKKRRAEMKQTLSKMDEIEFISSESLSPPPIPEEKRKPNKPKWRIQFHSDSFTDCSGEGEVSSPKNVLKTQRGNRKSDEVNEKVAVLFDKENPSKLKNSEPEKPYLNWKDNSLKHKPKKKKKDKSKVDEYVEENRKKKKGSVDKVKNVESKVDEEKEELINEIEIVEEILPKRIAPEKIAPLFIKKRKLDPAVVEARRQFLQSDLSESENQPTKRKPSPIRNPILPFPQISHVTQLDPDENFEVNEIKLRLKSPCNYLPSLDVSKFNNMTSSNESITKRWMTTFESSQSNVNIEEALTEIESRCNDARTMWKSIFHTAKAETLRQSPKERTLKRRAAAKKIANTEEKKIIDNHDNVWLYKYKPMNAQEVVGNEQAVAKLKTWLDKWKTSATTGGACSDDDFYSSDCSSNYSSNDYNQVAILLGPSGCGKTASVYAVAEEYGYRVLEINASSRRTGKKILKELEEATKSHRIKKSDMKQVFLNTKTEEKKIPQKSLILIEDVDIVFEEDEGFISAASQLATNTKRPIVMTCNETCSHLTKLAPQQLHIQFQATTGNRALALLELISLAETGRKLSLPCVENLLENGDLRKALLQLQYLLATEHNYVLPPVVDAQHRSGIPLWRKIHQCLYKPAVKSSRKRKKKISSQNSDKQDADVLNQLADDLERVSLISKLIDIDDVSWSSEKLKSTMSLSLSEDMRPYSYSDIVSSEIADWLTFEVIQKKGSSDQNSDQVVSKLLMRKTINIGINSVLSQIASTTIDKKMIVQDYLPSVRAICRAEETRNSLNYKRGNRFFHYLHGTKMPTNSTNILSAACRVLQENREKN